MASWSSSLIYFWVTKVLHSTLLLLLLPYCDRSTSGCCLQNLNLPILNPSHYQKTYAGTFPSLPVPGVIFILLLCAPSPPTCPCFSWIYKQILKVLFLELCVIGLIQLVRKRYEQCSKLHFEVLEVVLVLGSIFPQRLLVGNAVGVLSSEQLNPSLLAPAWLKVEVNYKLFGHLAIFHLVLESDVDGIWFKLVFLFLLLERLAVVYLDTVDTHIEVQHLTTHFHRLSFVNNTGNTKVTRYYKQNYHHVSLITRQSHADVIVCGIQQCSPLVVHLKEQMPHLDEVIKSNLFGYLCLLFVAWYHIHRLHVLDSEVIPLHTI